MGAFSTYLDTALMNHVFGRATFTAPAKWVALSTADPGKSGGGLAEPSGGGYARVQVANSGWVAAANRQTSNNGTITFAQATGNWGTCGWWAIFDAQTGGNMLAYGSLTPAKVVVTGNRPTIAAGQIVISLNSGAIANYLVLALLDLAFRAVGYSAPSIYMALSTANPTDAGSGLTEPSGNAYARVSAPSSSWTDATAGALDNSAIITFPTPTGLWGTLTHQALMDASSSGHVLFYAALAQAQPPNEGDTVRFPVGTADSSLN